MFYNQYIEAVLYNKAEKQKEYPFINQMQMHYEQYLKLNQLIFSQTLRRFLVWSGKLHQWKYHFKWWRKEFESCLMLSSVIRVQHHKEFCSRYCSNFDTWARLRAHSLSSVNFHTGGDLSLLHCARNDSSKSNLQPSSSVSVLSAFYNFPFSFNLAYEKSIMHNILKS